MAGSSEDARAPDDGSLVSETLSAVSLSRIMCTFLIGDLCVGDWSRGAAARQGQAVPGPLARPDRKGDREALRPEARCAELARFHRCDHSDQDVCRSELGQDHRRGVGGEVDRHSSRTPQADDPVTDEWHPAGPPAPEVGISGACRCHAHGHSVLGCCTECRPAARNRAQDLRCHLAADSCRVE